MNNNQFSGEISEDISNLVSLVKLRIQNNNISGLLPEEICFLNMPFDESNSFNISNNNICAPYPYCVDGYEGEQDTSSCNQLSMVDAPILSQYYLNNAYPNPFNPQTNIEYSIPFRSEVDLFISDVLGRRILTLDSGIKESGLNRIIWNGKDNSGKPVSTGIYYCTLYTDNYVQSTKLVLLK